MQHGCRNPAFSASSQLWQCRFSVLHWFDCSLTGMWLDSDTPRPAAPPTLIFVFIYDRRNSSILCLLLLFAVVQFCRFDLTGGTCPVAFPARSQFRKIYFSGCVQEKQTPTCCRLLSKLLPSFSSSPRSSMAVENGASDCWLPLKGYVCCVRPRRGRTSDASWLAAQTLSGLTWQRLCSGRELAAAGD